MTATKNAPDDLKQVLLDKALAHVPFDGWSEASFSAAIEEAGADPVLARAICPRGALDLAVAYHERGDALMLQRLHETDLSSLRMRDRIGTAVRFRLEAADDRELVRRGATLFSLPQNAALGARLIWNTADLIWTALGDRSDDVNWYSKRTILSGLYSSTVLYWLGDDSGDNGATWAFLDRRIDDVMQFEKVKATLGRNPLVKRILALPEGVFGPIRAPRRDPRDDLPGHWTPPR